MSFMLPESLRGLGKNIEDLIFLAIPIIVLIVSYYNLMKPRRKLEDSIVTDPIEKIRAEEAKRIN